MVYIIFTKKTKSHKKGDVVKCTKEQGKEIIQMGYGVESPISFAREKCDERDKKKNKSEGKKLLKEIKEKQKKNKNKKEKVEVSSSDNDFMSSIIFDKDEIIKNKIFCYQNFNNKTSYGIYLHKKEERQIKGAEEGETEIIQIQRPFLIFDDGNIKQLTKNATKTLNFQILDRPDTNQYPLRWDLKDLHNFIQKKNKPVNVTNLFYKIVEQYKKYLYFDCDEWYYIHALWDMGTYVYNLFEYYPLIELRGLKGRGKTKVMTMSRMFSFMASEEMTNASESTVFRWTDEVRGTKYIDECEKLYTFNPKTNKYESDPIAELINSGFKYTGNSARQEKINGKFITRYYSTYSPTMLGSINGLHGATEDRAIIHIMTKPPKKSNIGNLEPKENDPIFQEIRNELYKFGLLYSNVIIRHLSELFVTFAKNEDEEKTSIKKLKDRDSNLWSGLLTIAKLIQKGDANDEYFNSERKYNIYEKVLKFALRFQDFKQIESIPEESNLYKILKELYSLIKDGDLDDNKTILLKDLTSKVNQEYSVKFAEKTISNHLDTAGFSLIKSKLKNGIAYKESKGFFLNIFFNIFSSFPSFSSPNEDLYNMYNELDVNIDKEKEEKSSKKEEKEKVTNNENEKPKGDEYSEKVTNNQQNISLKDKIIEYIQSFEEKKQNIEYDLVIDRFKVSYGKKTVEKTIKQMLEYECGICELPKGFLRCL